MGAGAVPSTEEEEEKEEELISSHHQLVTSTQIPLSNPEGETVVDQEELRPIESSGGFCDCPRTKTRGGQGILIQMDQMGGCFGEKVPNDLDLTGGTSLLTPGD